MSGPPTHFNLAGNYLTPEGMPCIATWNDPSGAAPALAWLVRWIRAVTPEVTVFMNGVHGLKWDHGTTRHVLEPVQWLVWDGSRFRIVEAAEFAATYDSVTVGLPLSDR